MQKIPAKPYNLGIFIFRRDLRLLDNTGLAKIFKLAKSVLPVFIFDQKQIIQDDNDYFSHRCVQFMCESLRDLDSQIKEQGGNLLLLEGQYPNIIANLLTETRADLLVINDDTTPYAKKRDEMIEMACTMNGAKFLKVEDDITLLTDKQALGKREQFYKVFTPFYNSVSTIKIRSPEIIDKYDFHSLEINPKSNLKIITDFGQSYYEHSDKAEFNGGRTNALKILKKMNFLLDYENIRNDPSKKTSQLSAHLKFGTVSPREVYKHCIDFGGAAKSQPFTRQLYWRDFFYFVSLHYPHCYEGPMKPEYAAIKWDYNEERLNAWKEGRTGYPIVDAAMRHLNETGFMPNRCRMIVSNFLVKDLHIDWKEGEKYFAQKLIDYDRAQNSGGWQWSAGCGVDSQPYFRIFNPALQSSKFDPDASYIKKWIPSLSSLPPKSIHTWDTTWKSLSSRPDYASPIVVHSREKEECLRRYKTGLGLSKGADEELKPERANKRSKKEEQQTQQQTQQQTLKKSKTLRELFE